MANPCVTMVQGFPQGPEVEKRKQASFLVRKGVGSVEVLLQVSIAHFAGSRMEPEHHFVDEAPEW